MNPTTESEVLEKVQATLAQSQALYLSTCVGDVPWVAGVFFAHTDPFTLLVVLEGEGTTLHNLQANAQFSVVISSGNPFELFLQAGGHVTFGADEDALTRAKAALVAKVPEAEGFLSAPIPMQAVELHIQEWRATDVMRGWIPSRRLPAPMALPTA